MSLALLSAATVALNCAGSQSSALLWQEEPTQFQMELQAHDFSVSKGPFIWELEGREISDATDGSRIVTATIKGNPRASFSATLIRNGEDSSLNWQIVETTSKDGRGTLQAKGEATCSADNQVSTL
ncbi:MULTISPECIES: hypothetical protein [Sphingopyxis]|uniref:hypothetical protein n=1 Tax=Sphingopyxis TaxID=165697 RepID=UPI001646B0CC|nr:MULTISPECIES: hypothetical protein [Sphingopyxis]QXF12127.1 hypothetical protein HBA51_08145 [Sphingopyxis terrae subsp. terrae]